MVIDKIINNNIVSAFDEKGLEVVIMGRGIGFQMKRGQEVPAEKIEKVFRIKSQSIAEQLKELLAKMPLEQVQISNEIISHAKKTMKLKLNQSIYVTLTDHISFAISRCKKGIHLENALLWEIKRFYPQEFELGRYAVELVKKRLNVEMPEDEAGFIALHFVNAEYGTDIRDAVRFPNQMKEILGIVAEELGIEMDEGSLHYERFLTHVKFLLQRIYRKELLEEEENEITEMMQRKYPREASCCLSSDLWYPDGIRIRNVSIYYAGWRCNWYCSADRIFPCKSWWCLDRSYGTPLCNRCWCWYV